MKYLSICNYGFYNPTNTDGNKWKNYNIAQNYIKCIYLPDFS